MSTAMLKTDQLDTPVGPLRLEFGPDGLHAVTIIRSKAQANSATGPAAMYPRRKAFVQYFEGELDALSDIDVVMHGTQFQISVWQALRKIPPGATRSYSELARELGKSKAMRAVGSANGRNPLCIVVPCHRVISADGSLGGFSAGLDAKRWLLGHEGIALKA